MCREGHAFKIIHARVTGSMIVRGCHLHHISKIQFRSAMSGSKLDDLELPSAGLSYDWFHLEGLAERGATGRLVIAPGVLTRPDLDFNWDVVATAMQHMGARPGVDKLQDEVDLFFQRSRQKGKKPVSRHQASKVDDCMSF